MQFPESWLREYCNPNLTTEELSNVLTMAGLEVEEIWPAAPAFTGVVIGEIKEAVQHPDADRLRVCKVDIGRDELLQIVCGAPNARVGIRVPVATVGAELPPPKDSKDGKPFMIKVGKLRGVESFGMLCSAVELGISEEGGGLYELETDAPLGQSIREFLNLDDPIFLLKLTPDLAHCQSVYGIARELSALTGTPLKQLDFPAQQVTMNDTLPVDVQAPDLCGRFSGRLMRALNTQAKTPAWMVRRLERCGQRSVSVLVDISNYVMFMLGRPNHIFDADKIQGELKVRWGKKGEQLTLLNGNTVEVDETVGVIADDRMVESLAGIMGGEATSVSATTRDVYIEAAFWWPVAVAGRSRRYNFATDAGYRFERGVDPQETVEHIEYITALIQSVCATDKTQCGPITDMQPHMPKREPVTLRVARAAKILGVPVTQKQCVDALSRLGFPLLERDGEIVVTPPSYRFDIQYEEDLIEEVARIIGYDNFPVSAPVAPIVPSAPSEQARTPMDVRREMAALGYLETINFSFVPREWEEGLLEHQNPIKVLNPIASDLEVMRSSLLPSLLQVLKKNQAHQVDHVQVFELARVFKRDDTVENTDTTVKGIDQPRMLAGLVYGAKNPLHWQEKRYQADFFDLKGDVEALLHPLSAQFEVAKHPIFHPGRCANILLNGQVIGVMGELHPKWRQKYELSFAPVMFELSFDALQNALLPSYKAISRFPGVSRDMALVVPEKATYSQLVGVMQQAAEKEGILKDITLFDIYKPKEGAASDIPSGCKSMAFRFDLIDEKATLTD
ncbi:MAG: phenylalanine--tRNA ligase subunit beta, partial [Saezia sp.]